MIIEFEVTGGTHKTVKSTLHVNDAITGELQMNREDFTKFCDLVYQSRYIISAHRKTNGNTTPPHETTP